ncbi:MAG: chromate transporter [Firmicutes bacterium]|nr:chromate transporter [Bacillota bacterium]
MDAKTFREIFTTFAKVGMLTFGGGYAMLPLLQKDVIEGKGWATEEEVMDYYAISQCQPGMMFVTISSYIGYNRFGTMGAVAATAGVVTPSVVIIMILAAFLREFLTYPLVEQAFAAVRIAAAALVISAVVKLVKKGVKDIPALVLCVVGFLLCAFGVIGVVPLILLSAVDGILLHTPQRRAAKAEEVGK